MGEEYKICPYCSGSGESVLDGLKCQKCKGTGGVLVEEGPDLGDIQYDEWKDRDEP